MGEPEAASEPAPPLLNGPALRLAACRAFALITLLLAARLAQAFAVGGAVGLELLLSAVGLGAIAAPAAVLEVWARAGEPERRGPRDLLTEERRRLTWTLLTVFAFATLTGVGVELAKHYARPAVAEGSPLAGLRGLAAGTSRLGDMLLWLRAMAQALYFVQMTALSIWAGRGGVLTRLGVALVVSVGAYLLFVELDTLSLAGFGRIWPTLPTTFWLIAGPTLAFGLAWPLGDHLAARLDPGDA